MRVLQAVQLDHLVDREATKLSGGQQQRLALARALVMEPQLLLLDEPLSNLDAKLRDRMRSELKRLQRELGLTTVYVTHDQSEALALSHEIAVMNDGRVVQIGTPRQIYEQPCNQFVADFVGTTNFIGGTVTAVDDGNGRCLVGSAMGQLRAQASEGVAKDSAVIVSVRPEDVELSEPPPPAADGDNVCKAVVTAKDFLGEYLDFQVKVGDVVLLARAHPVAAHAGRRSDLPAHEGGEMRRHSDPVPPATAIAGARDRSGLDRSAARRRRTPARRARALPGKVFREDGDYIRNHSLDSRYPVLHPEAP